MTISRKAFLLSFSIITVALVFFTVSYVSVTGKIRRGNEETLTRLNASDVEMINHQITAFGEYVGSFLTSIEDEIDKTMHNAAIVLQTRLLTGDMDDTEMSALMKKTGMNDFYIAGLDGIFTQSTERGAKGISLFDIWDGYRMIADGSATVLPSPIKIKEETGEIYKFTAIPKINAKNEVTGILESALEASGSIGKMLQSQIDSNQQLNFINIIESSGLVLTVNAKPGSTASFKAGSTIRDAAILNVAKDDKPMLQWAQDNKSVSLYKPIKRYGFTAYILYLNIDPSMYLDNTAYVNKQFTEFEEISSAGVMTVSIVSGCLLAVTIMLYIFFIRIGMLRQFIELSRVLENITGVEGDLTKRLKVRDNSEIGKVAKLFNDFAERIMLTVKEAKNATAVVTFGASQVIQNVDASHEGIKTVSDNVKEFSKNIAAQAHGVEDCDKISEQLLRDYEYLTLQISEAISGIGKIMKNKEHGEQNISTLAKKSRIGAEKNEKTAREISELNSQITNITQIIDEIKTVAKQTKLLSFNASIEAASAGEHGKGFAVVAESVKELAEQSADSALKIEKIITSIAQSSASSVEAVTEVIQMMEEQNACVEEMKGTFSGIATEIDAINTVFGNVNQSISKVSLVSEKMRDGVRSIHEIGLENKRSIESVGNSMSLQVDAIESIKKLSDKTTTVVRILKETLDRFTVSE